MGIWKIIVFDKFNYLIGESLSGGVAIREFLHFLDKSLHSRCNLLSLGSRIKSLHKKFVKIDSLSFHISSLLAFLIKDSKEFIKIYMC